MKVKLRQVIVGLLISLSSACSSNTDENESIRKTQVQISPSKEVVVEGEGKELVFQITPTPASAQLCYASSVGWIKETAGKETSWTVAPNPTELSRKGRIYILDQSTMTRIDTIQVTQKSASGAIDEEPEYTFTEQEVPVFIPFAGNSYITSQTNPDYIDNKSGRFVSEWSDPAVISSTYFRVGAAGELKIAAVASNNSGYGKVRFTIRGKSHEVNINGPTSRIYSLTKIQIDQPGYVRIDMQGISRNGKMFGDVTGFRIGGQASNGTNNYVPEEELADSYWYRRGASVHWNYTLPSAAVEYFYNEIVVDHAVNNSYYMMNGFSGGYMGIQQVADGTHKVLFSVWGDDKDIEATRPIEVRKGKNVTIAQFDHEGSGRQSWLNYHWKEGVTYKGLVQVKPDGNGSTFYTAYFYADNEWKLIASFRRPKQTTDYKSAHSFLENFNPVSTITARSVLFKNQWARLKSGTWQELVSAKFTCDDTGRKGFRYDFSGETDQENHGFILKSFGFTDAHTQPDTLFTRQPIGVPPEIDFDALDQIPSAN